MDRPERGSEGRLQGRGPRRAAFFALKQRYAGRGPAQSKASQDTDLRPGRIVDQRVDYRSEPQGADPGSPVERNSVETDPLP